MRVGGNRSPYRPPCGSAADAPEVFWLGGPWQHYRDDVAEVEEYQNTTAGASAQDTPFTEPVAENTYAPYDPPQYKDFAQCQKAGFKVVFARKAWHGRYGFTDLLDNCCPYSATDGCCHHPAIDSPVTTKYLTITRSLTYNWKAANFDGTTYSGSGTAEVTFSVNRYSGKITQSGCVRTVSGDDESSGYDFGEGGYDGWSYLFNGDMSCGVFPDPGAPSEFDYWQPGYTPGADVTVTPATITNTSVTFGVSIYETEHIDGGTQMVGADVTVTWTLSDPYTEADLNADKDALLSEWDLSDDVQIPWRFDDYCTFGPLVTYFENGATPPPNPGLWSEIVPVVDPCGYTDGYAFDGSVLGAPLTPYSDPYFDFRYQHFDETDDDCLGVTEYGGFNGADFPEFPNATQWTNLLDGSSFYHGAFVAYNSLVPNGNFCGSPSLDSGDSLVGSKYAEIILLTQPSHDFARPCGPKDAATIDQTSIDCSGDGGTLRWSGIENPCPVPPADGGEWNDNSPKGDWCFTAWEFNYRDIGEEARIKAGITGDVSGNTLCEANPSEVIDRAVTGPWSDVSCTQYCSAFAPCCPAVVYITNNGESSENSTTITIPSLAPDETYGSLWIGAPMQWMTDPLWQPPQPPCDLPDGVTWTEDDGSGQTDTDTNWYYPQRPWEECRCSLPDGAPALEAGFLGCMSVADINAAGSYESAAASGNVCQPPTAGQCWMPWWQWAANRANNISSSGRFSCEYADPLAICDDDPEIEPP